MVFAYRLYGGTLEQHLPTGGNMADITKAITVGLFALTIAAAVSYWDYCTKRR